MIARENSSLRRRSGVRNAAANACSTCPPLIGRVRLAIGPPGSGAGRAEEGPWGPLRPRHGSYPEPAKGGEDGDLLRSDTGGAAPGRTDLLGRCAGERVRVHVDLEAAEVAGTELLDGLTAPDGAGLGQAVRVDRTALREERRDPVEVDDLEHDLVVVLEARELGQAHVQRRLPTLEPGGGVAASAGALGAATGGLALGALTTTDSRLRGVGAGGRTQVVDFKSHGVSSLNFFDGDQVRHRRDHAADLGTVLLHDRVVDPLQPEGTQRLALVLLAADRRLDLGDLELCHLRPPDPHEHGAWLPERRPRAPDRGVPRSPRGGRGPSAPASWRARC